MCKARQGGSPVWRKEPAKHSSPAPELVNTDDDAGAPGSTLLGLWGPDTFEVTTEQPLSFDLSCQTACVPSGTSQHIKAGGARCLEANGWFAGPRGAEA